MVSHSLAPEHSRETQTIRNLIFTNPFIAALRLSDNEFSNLYTLPSVIIWNGQSRKKLTWSSVSVIVDLLTRAYPDLLIPL